MPTVAWADYPFVLPSSTNLSGDNNTVTFDAAGSDQLFAFDHRPLQLATIRVTRPDGTTASPANPMQTRFRSVFDVKLDQSGTWRIASEQTMVVGTFKLNGEERRVGGRGGPPGGGAPRAGGEQRGGAPRQPPVSLDDLPAGATDLHLTELVRTSATFVTQGAPTTTVLKPLARGLEFDPITHPNSLAANETARFRFLLDGKPAAGITVTVAPGNMRYRDGDATRTFTTARDGTVAVTWPAAGMYWLDAEAEDRKPSEKRAATRRMSYAVTLEVATP